MGLQVWANMSGLCSAGEQMGDFVHARQAFHWLSRRFLQLTLRRTVPHDGILQVPTGGYPRRVSPQATATLSSLVPQNAAQVLYGLWLAFVGWMSWPPNQHWQFPLECWSVVQFSDGWGWLDGPITILSKPRSSLLKSHPLPITFEGFVPLWQPHVPHNFRCELLEASTFPFLS